MEIRGNIPAQSLSVKLPVGAQLCHSSMHLGLDPVVSHHRHTVEEEVQGLDHLITEASPVVTISLLTS